MKDSIKRRNLSGIYIFHKFDDEDKREPTCFEDCSEEKQDEWLNNLEPEAVKSLAKMLAKTLRTIGGTFDLIAAHHEEDKD
jgi:hypothetical protein